MKKGHLTIGGAIAAVLGSYVVMLAGEADAADTLISQGKPATGSSTESAAFPASSAVEPTTGVFYYLGEGVSDALIATTRPLPLGLRIVAGNANATGPNDNTISRWSCLGAGDAGSSHDFVNCPPGSMLESYLDFPHCWDGRNLDSADHKTHMSYPVNNACPASHPVVVPKLRQVMRYPVNGNTAGFRLASGPGYTMHGDFFNAWPVDEMARRVNDCIRPIIKCGANGRP
jgi:hypothetical protein